VGLSAKSALLFSVIEFISARTLQADFLEQPNEKPLLRISRFARLLLQLARRMIGEARA
jgi:hypothetical protein